METRIEKYKEIKVGDRIVKIYRKVENTTPSNNKAQTDDSTKINSFGRVDK